MQIGIRTIIVENEPRHSKVLENMLAQSFPEVEILRVCVDTPSSIQSILELKPDLVFLDVQLELEDSGFHILEETKEEDYKVVFTTAYSDYAERAFRFSAIDYLKKPFGKGDLFEALDRYKQSSHHLNKQEKELLSHNASVADFHLRRLVIPLLTEKLFIPLSEIIMCKADGAYCNIIQTQNRKVQISKNLRWAEERLLDCNFYRVHDAYLVNAMHIIKYKNQGEGGLLFLTDDQEAPIAKRRKDEFLRVFGKS